MISNVMKPILSQSVSGTRWPNVVITVAEVSIAMSYFVSWYSTVTLRQRLEKLNIRTIVQVRTDVSLNDAVTQFKILLSCEPHKH